MHGSAGVSACVPDGLTVAADRGGNCGMSDDRKRVWVDAPKSVRFRDMACGHHVKKNLSRCNARAYLLVNINVKDAPTFQKNPCCNILNKANNIQRKMQLPYREFFTPMHK